MRKNLLLVTQVAASVLLFFSCSQPVTTQKSLPNIVIILADDLGYGDIKALNPDSKLETPQIDNLISEGVQFSDAHSNSSVCTPTRYGILTGEYCWRSRIKKGVLLGYSPSLIEADKLTIPKFLKNKGYQTACIGKWHLGIDWKLKDGSYISGEPGKDFSQELIGFKDHEKIDFMSEAKGGAKGAGFDYSFILPASLDFQPYLYLENNLCAEEPTAQTEGNDLNTGATGAFWRPGIKSPSFEFDQVLPTFTDKAVNYINKQKDGKEPFFLYFPMNAPHTPWMPTDEFKGKSNVGQYGDYVQMVDYEVGKVLQALKENGLDENTLVFFTSDNGAYWKPKFIEEFSHRSNGYRRGMKADIHEGGHRIPFVVKWPGNIAAGTHSDETICLTDIFATIQAVIEEPVKQEAVDSYSLLPAILNQGELNRPPVIHHSSQGMFAIRKGEWKYVEGLGSGGFTPPARIEPEENGPTGQLYNMKSDSVEQNNLFLENQEKVTDLKNELDSIRE
ncbi:sulfatase family protein [Sunxiuqinia sp. A32]|uniref:sulfatase family protein n=1 Tax=Sunxiuqinia sp. A32 TaxID=3461496 RepID=UPI004045D2CD